MYSKRQNKVSRLIQKELADIFLRESKGMYGGAMITVTVVRISPDLGVAKVYLSVFAVGDPEKILHQIQESSRQIRGFLAVRVRHQLRKIPELIFYRDDSLDHIEHIEKLLDS